MTDSNKALAYGLATVTIWSTVASAFKIALQHLDPLQLLLIASATSILVLGAIVLAQGKARELIRLPRREMISCALLGVLNPFLYYVILFKAYALLPAQEAQSINYSWAVTLSLLAVPLLGQRMSLKDFAAILVCYFGVIVISTHGTPLSLHFSSPAGVALALGSTIVWALYWIYNTRSQADPMTGLLIGFLAGFPLILIATLAFSKFPAISLKPWLAAVYVGCFEMGITFALWISAMKFAARPTGGGTARVANLIFLSPFLSLIFIHFLIGEDILPSTVVGLGFIVAGNVLMQYRRNA